MFGIGKPCGQHIAHWQSIQIMIIKRYDNPESNRTITEDDEHIQKCSGQLKIGGENSEEIEFYFRVENQRLADRLTSFRQHSSAPIHSNIEIHGAIDGTLCVAIKMTMS